MLFICHLSKQQVVDMIKEVVFKTIDKFDIDNPEFELYLSKLALILASTNRKSIEFFRKRLDKGFFKNVDKNELEIIKQALNYFITLHSVWLEKECEINEEEEENSNCETNLACDNLNPQNSSQDDDFFEFDSEDIDESILKMHYTDERKISAEEFMKEGIIDDEFMEELLEALNDLDDVLYAYEDIEIDEGFLDKMVLLDVFIKTFNFSIEFKDIAYALENLRDKLSKIDLSTFSSDQKEILKQFIFTMVEDLKKWVDEVVINKTTKDIHYLDASLLANIAQMDIMLESFDGSHKTEDDDMEFF